MLSEILIANNQCKNFNSLQSYVRAIWVKTRKWQKWFWGDIIVLNSRLALTRLAILNTWIILLYILNKISL